jgi:hypothetical protein
MIHYIKFTPQGIKIVIVYDDKEPDLLKAFYVLTPGFKPLTNAIMNMTAEGSFIGLDKKSHNIGLEPLLYLGQYIPRVFQFKSIVQTAGSIEGVKAKEAINVRTG